MTGYILNNWMAYLQGELSNVTLVCLVLRMTWCISNTCSVSFFEDLSFFLLRSLLMKRSLYMSEQRISHQSQLYLQSWNYCVGITSSGIHQIQKQHKKTVFRNRIKFHADPDPGSKKMSIWVRIQTPNVKFESGTKGGLNLRRQLIPPNFSFQLSKPNFEKSTKQNIVDYLPNEVSFDFIDVWWVSSSSCSSTAGSSLSASGSSSGDRSSAVILQLSHLGSIDNHD